MIETCGLELAISMELQAEAAWIRQDWLTVVGSDEIEDIRS